LAYWNSPQGKRDEEFVSPFKVPETPGKTKYLTFEPDGGGWNNLRMSMEVSLNKHIIYALFKLTKSHLINI
jgi:hypothetical protein